MALDTPAGWYPDPRARSTQRFWDGARWTERVRPTPSRTGRAIRPVGADRAGIAIVLSIVGLLVPFLFPLSIAALVLAVRARREGGRSGRPVDGRMTAAFAVGIAGVVSGAVAAVLLVVAVAPG